MNKQLNLNSFFVHLRNEPCKTAFAWFFGLFLGTIVAAELDCYFASLMRPFLLDRVSIVGQLVVCFVPFLLIDYAASRSLPVVIYAFCFCRAFIFSASGVLIQNCFGSAGWLMRILLQFSDICIIPLLCWFSFYRTCKKGYSRHSALLIYGSIIGCTVILDRVLIIPVLDRLL